MSLTVGVWGTDHPHGGGHLRALESLPEVGSLLVFDEDRGRAQAAVDASTKAELADSADALLDTGAVNAIIEKAGLRIIAQKRIHMTKAQAQTFYAVHKERPFFGELVDFMISAPVVVQVLEGEGAIAKNRELMGATDPKKADKGTIRADFAESIDANAVHGSDAPETAAVEIAFFFPGMNTYAGR